MFANHETMIRTAVNNEAETVRLGARLAPVLRKGDVVRLEGPLGAGKTTLARGLIGAFSGAQMVPSPTYTLAEVYEGPDFPLWHFDMYRLERPAEIFELGFEEAMTDGASLIEWAGRIDEYIPDNALTASLEITGEHARALILTGSAPWDARLKDAGIT
ncbi:MAG: tRNA (adenosine(37)-N6)-threonylcarbamoyltransferase complex ATPase subunit type 1 TsaE [Pseudomonadota bacterium]